MEKLGPIDIQSSTERQQPSLKNGVWLATWTQETVGMNWFKHCGPGKINATRSTLLAIQTYTMVNNKMPAFVCHYGWAYSKSKGGFYEVTKVLEHDMHIDKKYHTPEDGIQGALGHDRNISCATQDSFTQDFDATCLDHTAFAIAKICAEMEIDFRCYKFLSTNRPYVNHDAWIEDCVAGAELMREMCSKRFGDVPYG